MFGERLRALRLARGMSQEELEAATGIRQTNISRLERTSRGGPGIATVLKLADALGVTPEELTGAPIPQPLTEQEWRDLRDGMDRLPPAEQRTFLGLVRRLAALPPETQEPPEEGQPQDG